jgi:hypothetical protein
MSDLPRADSNRARARRPPVTSERGLLSNRTAVAIYCAVALGLFHRGLRTYESGNRFGTGR